MKKRTYAREITKEYLISLGVENVAKDGTEVIVLGRSIHIGSIKSGKKIYKVVRLFDREKRLAVAVEKRNSSTGQFTIGVHVLNYVWNKEDKREGLVIDHIDNNTFNNHISNLQMITQRENVLKERGLSTREQSCCLSKPRSYYVEKLEQLEKEYEQAKKDRNTERAHSLRSNKSQYRARLRYYDAHIEEYKQNKFNNEHPCHARAEKRRELQAEVDTARKFYKEALEAYGRKDSYVERLHGEWKLAIARLCEFKEENKKAINLG
jgi:hypothetical protein